MNLVRSNYKGRHIHSPFAYHLVSEVIFSKTWFADEYRYNDLQMIDADHQKYRLLIRLLHFFKPQTIAIRGVATESFENLIANHYKPENPIKIEVGEKILVQSSDFVIWAGIQNQKNDLRDNISESIWFMFDIQSNNLREFFENLKLNSKVSQTYELNSCGIAIFNPKFQKQDFVIKGKKSY